MFFFFLIIVLLLYTENGEDIQVLHYEYGQKYEPHYDYFTDTVNTLRGGHRIATVLMYLSDVEKGGETVFPLAEVTRLLKLFVFISLELLACCIFTFGLCLVTHGVC